MAGESQTPGMQEHGHMLPALYQAQAVQGWSNGMLRVIDSLLERNLEDAGCLLELGCGGGHFLQHWQEHHQRQTLYGVDLHAAALPQARSLLRRSAYLCQSDGCFLPFPTAYFDAVVAFDVLDQRGVETRIALAESWRVLKPEGWLLLRVSAYQWLYGMHDLAFNTAHRFTPKELSCTVTAAGFRVERITFANSLLAIPLITLRLLQRWRWMAFRTATYRSSLTNHLLERVLNVEAALLQRMNLPAGLSLYLLAKK